MRPEELLAKVEALGVIISVDDDHLRVRPKSRLTPELIANLRAHKTELQQLLEMRGWPEVSRRAARRFGTPVARLYPFVGRTVLTPHGAGQLVHVLSEWVGVLLQEGPARVTRFLPWEVRPDGVEDVQPIELKVH